MDKAFFDNLAFPKLSDIKFVVSGDGAIGKTSLLYTMANKKFPQEFIPTVLENYFYKVSERSICLWDTAGREDYDRLRPLSYPHTDVFICCFSIVQPSSYHNVKSKWIPEYRHFLSQCKILLVGTKSDLRDDPRTLEKLSQFNEKPITHEQGKQLAKEMGCIKYIECSALTSVESVENIFDTAAKIVLEGATAALKKKSSKGFLGWIKSLTH